MIGSKDTKTYRPDAILRPHKPRWHSWIARPPPKGQVTGSTPVRGTINKPARAGFFYGAPDRSSEILRFESRVAAQTAEGCPEGVSNLA